MGNTKRVSEKAKANLVFHQVARDTILAETPLNPGAAIEIQFNAPPTDEPIAVLASFANCVYAGVPPPALTLIVIAEWINAYLFSKGALSLDEAFHLKSIQKSGHPVKARTRQAQLNQWALLMYQLRKHYQQLGQILSIEAAASAVINKLSLRETEDTLIKHYTKNRIEQQFDRLAETLRPKSRKK